LPSSRAGRLSASAKSTTSDAQRRSRWPRSFSTYRPTSIRCCVTSYLVYSRVQEFGPRITIKFKDGSGLRAGGTPIKYRGVPIGEVTALELSEDQQQVLVRARLRRSAVSIAREGSIFWVVRPEVGIGSITGLGTVITGPEIVVLPGTGEAKSAFVGLESSPVALERMGLKIVLLSRRLGSLKPSLDPKKILNRHDAKAFKDTGFRTLHRRTRKPILGAFRSFVRVPPGRPIPLAFLAPWRERFSDWG